MECPICSQVGHIMVSTSELMNLWDFPTRVGEFNNNPTMCFHCGTVFELDSRGINNFVPDSPLHLHPQMIEIRLLYDPEDYLERAPTKIQSSGTQKLEIQPSHIMATDDIDDKRYGFNDPTLGADYEFAYFDYEQFSPLSDNMLHQKSHGNSGGMPQRRRSKIQ